MIDAESEAVKIPKLGGGGGGGKSHSGYLNPKSTPPPALACSVGIWMASLGEGVWSRLLLL